MSSFGFGNEVRQLKKEMREVMDMDVYSMSAPSFIQGIDFSDHLSYWRNGFPALMITDTAFYRSDNYHTEHDTPETLDYAKMADVVNGVYWAIYRY